MAATEEAAPRHRSKWGQKVRKIAYLQQLVQPNGVVGLHGNGGLCQFSRVRAGDEVGQLERRGSSGTRGVRQREEGVHMATACATIGRPAEGGQWGEGARRGEARAPEGISKREYMFWNILAPFRDYTSQMESPGTFQSSFIILDILEYSSIIPGLSWDHSKKEYPGMFMNITACWGNSRMFLTKDD